MELAGFPSQSASDAEICFVVSFNKLMSKQSICWQLGHINAHVTSMYCLFAFQSTTSYFSIGWNKWMPILDMNIKMTWHQRLSYIYKHFPILQLSLDYWNMMNIQFQTSFWVDDDIKGAFRTVSIYSLRIWWIFRLNRYIWILKINGIELGLFQHKNYMLHILEMDYANTHVKSKRICKTAYFYVINIVLVCFIWNLIDNRPLVWWFLKSDGVVCY